MEQFPHQESQEEEISREKVVEDLKKFRDRQISEVPESFLKWVEQLDKSREKEEADISRLKARLKVVEVYIDADLKWEAFEELNDIWNSARNDSGNEGRIELLTTEEEKIAYREGYRRILAEVERLFDRADELS